MAGRKKGNMGRNVIVKTLTTDDLIKLVAESGIPIRQLEVGVGMPIGTLDKCLKKEIVNGHVRTLPAKYESPLIQFIKEKKAAKEELLIETKEVFQELNIPIIEPEVYIPDEQRKLDWISKLQEVKSEQEAE